ncbi:transporter [Hyphomicrobium sp. 2TAF46]|uniref:transporter n=1 Tax=Hyphomicrobium sp. 2TAF46 TaxID=3233019 RepID=UPI003F903347
MMINYRNRFLSGVLGLSLLWGSIAPAAAVSWTPPGVTMGVPLGAAFAPGLYVSNLTHYGDGPDKSITADVPAFTWSSGWKFLGASYSAVVIPEVLQVQNKKTSKTSTGIFSPLLIPASLSWNLGQGFFVSVGEGIYFPFDSNVSFTTPGQTSGWAAETRVAFSYLKDGWIVSANTIYGLTTADAVGRRQPNYFNVDWTVAHAFGKWQVGAVGYGAWDLEETVTNAAVGKGHIVGVGGMVGYDFGSSKLLLELTHAVDQGGATNYSRNDTHVWARLTFPIWQPSQSNIEHAALK